MFGAAELVCRVPSSLSHSGSPRWRAVRVDSHVNPLVGPPQVSCAPSAPSTALKEGSLVAATATCQVRAGWYPGPGELSAAMILTDPNPWASSALRRLLYQGILKPFSSHPPM